jgi:hypothetical protein
MSDMKKENKHEIKRMAAADYREIKSFKKELSSALDAYKKAATPIKRAVLKYERAMKKYNSRQIEKNMLICHFAKEKLVDAVLRHNDAARVVNSLVERIDDKYKEIADVSLVLDGDKSVVAVNKRMRFLRKTVALINEAEQITSDVSLLTIDEETREIISWKRWREEDSSKYDNAWSAHDLQDAIVEKKVELGFYVKQCERLAKRLASAKEDHSKAKARYEAIPGAKRELSYAMAREDYVGALTEYNKAATELNRCVDAIFDGYDFLKAVLSENRKGAALRVAAEQDRYKAKVEAKMAKINKLINNT